jgi:hypothetical protein
MKTEEDLEAAQKRIRELEDQVRDLKGKKDAEEKAPAEEAKAEDAKSEDAKSEDAKSDPPASAPIADSDDGADKDAVFEALWARVLEAWDDDKPHAAILQHAIKQQMMPNLAGRYRKLKDDEAKGARAQKKIDGIVIAATQMLMATKTPPRTKTPWQWTATAAAVFLIVMAYLLYAIVLRRH